MADIRLMLGRLRPTSAYHWLGGAFDDYNQIGEWRDLLTIKPTLADIEAEWQIYLIEKATQDAFEAEKAQAEIDAVAAYPTLPDWLKTWTAQQTSDYVHDAVFNGQDAAAVKATIAAQLTDITIANVSQINVRLAVIRTLFGNAVDAIIAIRNMLEIIAKLLMYIRDLVIKYRQQA